MPPDKRIELRCMGHVFRDGLPYCTVCGNPQGTPLRRRRVQAPVVKFWFMTLLGSLLIAFAAYWVAALWMDLPGADALRRGYHSRTLG